MDKYGYCKGLILKTHIKTCRGDVRGDIERIDNNGFFKTFKKINFKIMFIMIIIVLYLYFCHFRILFLF